MGTDDVPLICFFGGKLTDEDRDARYIGGITKRDKVRKSIGFASFKEKLQEMIDLPSSGMEFKIKCGVRYDEVTLIGFDVYDDKSLHSIMDDSIFIRAYILEDVPPAATFTASKREDLVLPIAAVQFHAENPIDGNSNHKPLEIKPIGVKPPENGRMSTSRDSLPTGSEWFHEKLLPFITGHGNPSSDGNCGFRALCMALGRNESEWAWMRTELVKEIESNKVLYHQLFSDEETCALLERTRHAQGPAPESRWMLMPYTGFVFAQAFKVVLVYYFEKNGYTFVPFLSPPIAGNVKILGIGHLKNNHYIKLDFQYDCQLPPFPHILSNWRRICPVIANSWEELLAPRLLTFRTMNIPELQIDKCPPETFIIDEEDHVLPSAPLQFQAKNLVDGTSNNYPVEDIHEHGDAVSNLDMTRYGELIMASNYNPVMDVNEHGDVNCIDVTGVNINRLEDMHDRFSHSNVDQHDEEINLPISNQEDDNVVHMQEEMIYDKNQVTSQMEQMIPPSDADVCIPTSGYEPAPLEFSDYGFAIGREFPDIDALRNDLFDMAVRTGREYTHARTSPSQLSMKCSSEGCKWRILARRLPNSPTFKVVKYEEVHTCVVLTNSGDKDHPQATIRWILSKVQSNIEKDPEMEPMKIVKEMKDRYGILISYNKAVKAKTRALNLMRNRLKDSYSRPHPDICHALIKELERGGTICRLGLSSDGTSSFQHLFWVFPACVETLRNHLRPVIYVRSVKIEIGVLMYAHGIDGSGFYSDFIQVGFALCAREDEKSWERFLSWLKEFVLIQPQPPLTFTIVTDFEKTALTRAVENVLPHLHHFFSSYSFEEVFSQKFNDHNLHHLCWKACKSFSTEECEAALQEIRRLNEGAYEWIESVGSKSHWAIAFSLNKHVWAVTEVGCELVSVIENKTSVVEIVESSRDMVANYFSERLMEGAERRTSNEDWAPGVMKDIGRAEDSLRRGYEVDLINGHKYQVTRRRSSNATWVWVVDLEERSCTCGAFQATEYPCRHAFQVIVHLELDVKDYLSHRWYSLDTYLATYAGTLPPPINVDISQWQTAFNEIPDLPPKRTQRGRPRKRQRKGSL